MVDIDRVDLPKVPKKIEECLKESEQKFDELANSIPEMVFELDTRGVLTYANKKIRECFELTPADISRGVEIFDYILPEQRNLARSRLMKVFQDGDVGANEYTLVKKDGTSFLALVHTKRFIRENKVQGVVGIGIDITQQNLEKQTLLKYKTLMSVALDGYFIIDLQGNFLDVNDSYCDIIGYRREELLKMSVSAVEAVETPAETAAHIKKIIETGRDRFETKQRRKDGRIVDIEVSVNYVDIEGGRHLVFVRDITERKRISHDLITSELRYRRLFETAQDGILILDGQTGAITDANPFLTDMLGYSKEELLGKKLWEIGFIKDLAASHQAFETLQEKGFVRYEDLPLETKYGKSMDVEFVSNVYPVDGKLVIQCNIRDITERKKAEEEVSRSNKELEQFAYVASHDLREPLRMVSSFSELLQKHYKDKLDNNANDYIGFIVDGSARMQNLIDDLLLYSRVGTKGKPFEPVAMEAVLQDVVTNLKVSIEETKTEISHDPLPVIQADAPQMGQVLQNLISNAIKFHREEPPRIHVSAVKGAKEWTFSVKDNGIGIDPQLFDRLFIIFQRLQPREKYPGTGIGLAVAKKIVQRHGGRIWVESQPGQGSTFFFTIPMRSTKGGNA